MRSAKVRLGMWSVGAFTAALALAAAPVAATAQPARIAPGDRYVAMGSSFAAGPGITASADTPATRCGRSADNYAHQLARRLKLDLVDVSCSGATTANLLGPFNDLPPQLDAVTPDTRLVTVTVGGNDVNYSRGLAAMGCVTAQATQAEGAKCGEVPAPPTAADYEGVETHLRQIAREVRRRAPGAMLVFVDYPTVLPPSGVCPALQLTPAQADLARSINQGVVAATARAARAEGARLVTTSALSSTHHACSADPWTNGYRPAGDGVAYHPRLAAHTAAAEALARMVGK